jgi:5'-AMP-activated protein kinase catalytic alpha subunit
MNDTNAPKKIGNLGQFILGKTIGEGTFGRVKIATHINTGEKVN